MIESFVQALEYCVADQLLPSRPMPPRARIYFDCVSGTGLFLLANGLVQFAPVDMQRFFAYLAMAMLSATWRVQIASVPVTLSPVFGYVLIGIADLSLGEAMLVACGATLVQCLWRPPTKRSSRKTVFNIAAVATALMFSYNPSHFVLAKGLQDAPRMLSLAAILFFVTNTGLVAAMIALMQEGSLRPVWWRLAQRTLPYYLVGAVIAALTIVANRFWGWHWGLLVAPLPYAAYQCYLLLSRRRGVAET